MELKIGSLLSIIQCMLVFSSTWATEECEETSQQLRSCSEERRHVSKKYSICEENVQDLQGSIRQLESELQGQSEQCRTAALKDRAGCNLETEKLQQMLQSIENELEESNSRASNLADELQDTSDRANRVEEQLSKCESEARQKEMLCQQVSVDLQKKLTASEAAREDIEGQASAASAVREEARLLKVKLEQDRENCKAVNSQHQVECDARTQAVQRKLEAAEADHASITGHVDSLSVEVQSCRAALEEESASRRQVTAQAALQESLHTKISRELQQKEELLAEHDRGKKEEIEELRVKLQHVSNVAEQEINKLKSELSKVGEQFRSAEQAYLPLWTIPYYDEAAKHASAARDHAISYYDKEIATGKAYQRSKQAVVEASERLQVMAEPHVSKARVVVEPMLSAVIDKLEPTWQSIQKQLQKDQYRKINEAVSKLKDAVNGAWKRASQLVADVYDSDVVIQARDDLTQMYSLLLGANVSGSGIDEAIPDMMAQYTLVGIPLLLLFPALFVCCSRSKPEKEPPGPVKPKAQLATSKSGDTKRSRRR